MKFSVSTYSLSGLVGKNGVTEKDLIKIAKENNISLDDEYELAHAIAVKEASYPNQVECYLLQYQQTYDELKAYILDKSANFSYNELRKVDLSRKIK